MLVTPISSYFLWREGPNIYINGVIRYCSDNIARIFSCTMLCEASGTTLHRICSCLLSEALRTTLHRVFYLCNVVLAVLRQHCTWFFFLFNVVWSISGTTAQSFICVILSQEHLLRQLFRKNFMYVVLRIKTTLHKKIKSSSVLS